MHIKASIDIDASFLHIQIHHSLYDLLNPLVNNSHTGLYFYMQWAGIVQYSIIHSCLELQ
jgi:hypothetical protein